MKTKSFALTACSALLLSACGGFEPMYGTAFQSAQSAEAQATLGQVSISNIPDREGQYLRNALIDRFYTSGYPANPRYSLTVSKVEESIVDLDITKSSDATRGQLKLTTTISLSDNETGEVVLTRALRSISSYNILTSEFSTRVTEGNTRENALIDLARQIEQQVVLFLKR